MAVPISSVGGSSNGLRARVEASAKSPRTRLERQIAKDGSERQDSGRRSTVQTRGPRGLCGPRGFGFDGRRGSREEQRGAKVAELALVLLVVEDVGRLEVAMQHGGRARVQVRATFGHVVQVAQQFRLPGGGD
eukprot:1185134-Prymnesium_polylepis.1